MFREWQTKNLERRREYKREWSRSHRQSVAKTFQKWKSKNADSLRKKQAEYAKKVRPQKKAYMKNYAAQRYKRKRSEILEKTREYARLHPEVRLWNCNESGK